jgi:lysophospholipase L1-like esterase
MKRALGWIGWGLGGLAALAIGAALLGLVVLYAQASRRPEGRPQYVALGSSFAAGLGLGSRAPRSPFVCQRSENGYPSESARLLGLSLVDMTCSGATTKNVLAGGQVFLGSQIDALGPETELVTLTTGGNDLRYVGDLTFMAGGKSETMAGWIMRRLWSGPMEPRPYAEFHRTLVGTLGEVRRRAPRARIVVLTYPTILPPSGSCPRLQMTPNETEAMRAVGDRLAETTRAAAAEAGAEIVDMHRLGAAHHACSAAPWVNGWLDTEGAPFHPTRAGAQATAQALRDRLREARS